MIILLYILYCGIMLSALFVVILVFNKPSVFIQACIINQYKTIYIIVQFMIILYGRISASLLYLYLIFLRAKDKINVNQAASLIQLLKHLIYSYANRKEKAVSITDYLIQLVFLC